MTQTEALKLALEALEYLATQIKPDYEHSKAITAIKATLEANEFNPDWDTQSVLTEEIQRMAKRIEELEAKGEPMEFFDWYDNAHWGNEDFKEGCHRAWNAAIKYTAKTNLEAKDEPVAWVYPEFWQHIENLNCGTAYRLTGIGRQPLYTTQPQRKPLTDEQIEKLWESTASYYNVCDFARAIEAAHGIKGEA